MAGKEQQCPPVARCSPKFAFSFIWSNTCSSTTNVFVYRLIVHCLGQSSAPLLLQTYVMFPYQQDNKYNLCDQLFRRWVICLFVPKELRITGHLSCISLLIRIAPHWTFQILCPFSPFSHRSQCTWVGANRKHVKTHPFCVWYFVVVVVLLPLTRHTVLPVKGSHPPMVLPETLLKHPRHTCGPSMAYLWTIHGTCVPWHNSWKSLFHWDPPLVWDQSPPCQRGGGCEPSGLSRSYTVSPQYV